MLVRRLTLTLALTLGLLPSAGAQLQWSATATDVTDRQTVSLAVSLTNTGPAPRDASIDLALPVGWSALISPRPLTLAPGERTVEVIVVRVPRTAPAGRHPLVLTVDGVSSEVSVHIPQRDALDLRALGGRVTDGLVDAAFEVRNDGNAPAQVAVTVAGQGAPRVTPDALSLMPGEARTLRVSGAVPSGLSKYSLTVRARTGTAAAQAGFTADVLTPAPDARSAWHTLPATLQLEAGPDGPHVRLTAEGALAPGLYGRLNAEPGLVNAELRTQDARVTLGQAAPGFSQFTVRPPALVLQGDVTEGHAGPDTMRAYVGLRRDLPGQPVMGLELGRRFAWGDARAGLDLTGEGITATLAARSVTVHRNVGSELGLRADGLALVVEADTALPDNALGLRRVGGSATYRSPGFDGRAGQLAGAAQVRGQAGPFSVGARLSGTLELGPAHAVVARTVDFTVGSQTPQLSLTGSVGWTERPGTQESTFTTRVDVLRRFDQASVWQAVTSERTFQAGVPATDLLKYGAGWNTTFRRGTDTFTLKSSGTVVLDLLGGTGRVGAGVDGTWLSGSGTRVEAGFTRPDFSQPDVSIHATLEQPLPGGATLLTSVQHYVGVVSRTTLRLAARIPLNVPLYLRPDIGRLDGRVLDAGGRGVAGVTVQVRSYLTVTDAQGAYRFPALPQGDHIVQVQAPGGQWCTPPQPVAVVGGARAERHFTCVAASQVTARLMEHAGGKADALLALPGVLVTLKGPHGRFTATSDASGRLSFGALPAGPYQVAITPPSPVLFRTLIPEVPATVNVPPGQTELNLRFSRKPRVVQMQDDLITPVPLTPSPTLPGDPQ